MLAPGKLAAVLGFAALATVQANGALVAHYTFDNAAQIGQDVSGNGYNGTASGGVSSGVGAVGSGSVQFDGTGVIEVPYASPLTLSGSSYTVALWAKVSAQPGAFVSGSDNQGDTNGGYGLAARNNGILSVHNNGANNNHDFPIASSLAPWAQYTLVYDNVAQTRTLYVNGVQTASVATVGAALDRGSEPLRLGSLFNPDIGYFYRLSGSLDDVRLYNQALSGSEVAALVPEPSMLAVAGIGVLGLLRRKRASC